MKKTILKLASAVCTVLAMVLMSGSLAFAQNRSISGTVVDGAGVPIIGATVMVVGNNSIGAVTNADGAFQLSVPAGANIAASCIGYATQTVPVGNQTIFNFILEEDTEFLEETVVIGYGVQRKSDLTGAVASVGEADFTNRSTSDAASRPTRAEKEASSTASFCSGVRGKALRPVNKMRIPSGTRSEQAFSAAH